MSKFILSAFADEIAPDLAKQMEVLKIHNINHIEVRRIDNKNITEFTMEEAKEIKKKLDAEGFHISAIGSPIGKVQITDDFTKDFEKFKHTIELAKIFGTKYIRMFSFHTPKGEDPEQYKDEVISRWKQYLALAEEHDIILLHENEKNIYGDVKERCKIILDEMNSPRVKAVFDPANFVQVGEDTREAFELLKDNVVYMHIKDAEESGRVVPAGYGIGYVEYILTKLYEDGYEGFLSLEPHLTNFEGFAELEVEDSHLLQEGDSVAAFGVAVKALKKILAKIEAR